MRGSIQANLAADADAYLAWWNLAGVDCALDEAPVNWLRPAPAPVPVQSGSPAALPQPKPDSFEAFRTWLAEDGGQPERRWPGAPILPQGPVHARFMVIIDMPDPADMTAGMLLTDRAGMLFDAMLRAIGLARDGIHIASLFLSRPAGGMVEASDLDTAAARMRTHVMLAAPQRLLLLGDRTIRTLLPAQTFQGTNSLQIFNHDGGTVPALATFHPRLLLNQPAAKAECWRTLQNLIEEMPK